MLTLKASANDIERALAELHHLASTGTNNDARIAGQLMMALWNGDRHPLNLAEFRYLDPVRMRQALQLFAFFMTTGTTLKKFMSEEAAQEIADNLGALNGQHFRECNPEHYIGDRQAKAAPTPPPSRLLPETATR